MFYELVLVRPESSGLHLNCLRLFTFLCELVIVKEIRSPMVMFDTPVTFKKAEEQN